MIRQEDSWQISWKKWPWKLASMIKKVHALPCIDCLSQTQEYAAITFCHAHRVNMENNAGYRKIKLAVVAFHLFRVTSTTTKTTTLGKSYMYASQLPSPVTNGLDYCNSLRHWPHCCPLTGGLTGAAAMHRSASTGTDTLHRPPLLSHCVYS